MPTIFTGIRISGAAAILVLIAAEMIGATAGLGFLITYSQFNFLIPKMYAAHPDHLGARPRHQLLARRAGTPVLALARLTEKRAPTCPTTTR